MRRLPSHWLQSLPLHITAPSQVLPAPFFYSCSRGSAGGDCRATTPTPSTRSPSLGVTQSPVQREQQCLGALCPACRDRAALRNDEPGLSPAEGGLRHQPKLHVGWERHRQGGSPRSQMSRSRTAAAAPPELYRAPGFPAGPNPNCFSPHSWALWQGSGPSFPSSFPPRCRPFNAGQEGEELEQAGARLFGTIAAPVRTITPRPSPEPSHLV